MAILARKCRRHMVGFVHEQLLVTLGLRGFVVGFGFCFFFVDHVDDQLCDNDCATSNNRINDSTIRIDEANKWLNNKKKITQIDLVLIEIERFYYWTQQPTNRNIDSATRIP